MIFDQCTKYILSILILSNLAKVNSDGLLIKIQSPLNLFIFF